MVSMEDLLEEGLTKALEMNAEYADIRYVENKYESIEVKNGHVEALSSGGDKGFGIRVIVNGAWGFASSFLVERDEILRITDNAVRIARASARVKTYDVILAGQAEPPEAAYDSSYKYDPFEVPLEDRVSLLVDATKRMQIDDVKIAAGFMGNFKTQKIFKSSEGANIKQNILGCGAGIEANAISSGESHKRSYPCSFRGNYATLGYEHIKKMKLLDNAGRVAREAVEILSAKPCPHKKTNLILESSQLALQVHESCGHPTELDRVYGDEASFAGESFLTTDKLNDFTYGSEIVSIDADATVKGGLGSFGFDDEGTPAKKSPLVSKGKFVGYLMSRETAGRLGKVSNGAMRATGWNRIPLIRMTNINLRPGDWKFDELIEDTKSGIYMVTNRSWSIDDRRLNFQFGTELGYEIKNGELGAMIKNPVYSGMTPEFWGSCNAICHKKDWTLWGVPNCGKGEPMQVIGVGHGAAPARFKNVQVGVSK
jgi:TldD protein